MRKVRMAPPPHEAQGVPATRKAPTAAPLSGAPMVVLPLSVRMEEPRIGRPLTAAPRSMEVRFMAVLSTGHGWQHPTTVRLSLA